jgi:lipopolysaccharide/colanic/teichoic acid biosynthesis glycosyltransferase
MPSDAVRAVRSRLKRGFDVAAASLALVLLSPVMLAAAAAVWLSMGRPILFRQTRPGYKGAPFRMYKFRTMREPRPGEVWYDSDARRLTRVGRVLRRTSVDELPELWNVLRGEMSLVGPRPLLMQYLPRYTPEQQRRHDVRPGITGWSQVNGRQDIPFSRRLELDVWYVNHWSFWLDLKIVMMTVAGVFSSRGVVSGQDVREVDDLGLLAEAPAGAAEAERP